MDTLTEQETEDLALVAQRVRAWRVKYDARIAQPLKVRDLISDSLLKFLARSVRAGYAHDHLGIKIDAFPDWVRNTLKEVAGSSRVISLREFRKWGANPMDDYGTALNSTNPEWIAFMQQGSVAVWVEALTGEARTVMEQRGSVFRSNIYEWLIKPTDEYGSALNTKALRGAKAHKIVQAHTPSESARIPTRVLRHVRQIECVAKIESGRYTPFLLEVALRITARQFESFVYAVFKDHPLLISKVKSDSPMAFEDLARKANKQDFRRACVWLIGPKETALPNGVHWAVEFARDWLTANPE